MRLPSGSRRRRSALGAIALVFLTACPGAKPAVRPSAPVPGTPGPRGGELVIAYPHEPATLNPFLVGGDAPATRDLVRPFMPALYVAGPKGAVTPSLVRGEPEEWSAQEEGSPNRFGIRLTIRDDAVWSDGSPITAEDVRFTWQTVMTKRWPVASRDGYDKIADVSVESPKVFSLIFHSRPFSRWKDLFSSGLGVLPKHMLAGKNFDSTLASSWPVSGGPFVFKTWTRGLQIVYERNPRAWERVPALDRIRVEFVPDVVTAFQLLERGEIDALGPYPGVDMQRRGALVPAGVTSDIGATWAGAFLNVRTARLADARVRRALALSIDRRAIALGLVRDEGELLNDLAPIGSGAFASLKPDLGEAKRLLEAAGWALSSSGVRRKAGRELSFTFAIVGADQLPSRISHALHAQAERAGFDLNEVSLEADRFWRDWLRGSRFEAAFLVVRDPGGGALRARFGSRQGGNFSKLADPTLDRLLASADGSLESPSLEQVAQRLAALVPAIPLYRMRVVLIAGLHARGLQANASADGFLWNAAEWSRAA